MVTRITQWRSTAVRRIGRMKLRWNDDVREDIGKINIQNWSKMAMDRETRKTTVEQAGTRKESQRRRRRRIRWRMSRRNTRRRRMRGGVEIGGGLEEKGGRGEGGGEG
jgi:hypothetical protein